MADKSIVDLPQLSEVTDATLIPVYQPNSDNPAQKMPSSVFRNWAEDAVFPAAKMAQEASAVAVGAEAGAKQAWTGVQNAIKNIPSGSTPIVNDLTTGGTRMALSAEMGMVLGRRPNPNLIDNWYFPDPINQRGQTQYTGGTYTIDRWKIITSATTVTCGSDGVSVYTATASLAVIRQDIELSNLDNRTVTLSMLLADGTLCTDSGNTNGITSGSTSVLALADGTTSGRYAALFRDDTTKLFRVQLKAPTGVEMKVVAVKLELGDTQTLAHLDTNGKWVLNELPDKSKELLKCCLSTADASDTYANNKKTAAAVNALALDGSNGMTGALAVNGNYANVNGNANRAQLRFNPIPGDTTQATSIGIYDGRNGLASIARLYAVVNGQEKPYDILHTGNKPSGSYTGNGSAVFRVIQTGGIGNMLIIWSTTGKAFVTPGGGIHAIGNTITNFPASGASSVASFVDGVLTLGTDDQTMNTNGQTYHYQVL